MSLEHTELRTVIVAAVEPSGASDAVIDTASALSRIVAGAELHFVHVLAAGPPAHEIALPVADLVADAKRYLDGVVATAAAYTPAAIRGHVGVGPAAEGILQLATDVAADLIVVGTHHKRGVARIVGSVSERVLRHATCPVLLAQPKREGAASTSDVAIEPPCPACNETQRATKGEQLWCDRHAQRHLQGHLHYSAPNGYGGGSMFIRS